MAVPIKDEIRFGIRPNAVQAEGKETNQTAEDQRRGVQPERRERDERKVGSEKPHNQTPPRTSGHLEGRT